MNNNSHFEVLSLDEESSRQFAFGPGGSLTGEEFDEGVEKWSAICGKFVYARFDLHFVQQPEWWEAVIEKILKNV